MNERFNFRTPIYGADEKFKKFVYWNAENGFPATTCRIGDVFKETEQCTGLSDKNGKLIYEGDIVLLDDTDSFENPIKTVVRWAEENASFGLFHSHNLYYGFFSYESENFEVIGNIHEHGGLLKEKSEKPIFEN